LTNLDDIKLSLKYRTHRHLPNGKSRRNESRSVAKRAASCGDAGERNDEVARLRRISRIGRLGLGGAVGCKEASVAALPSRELPPRRAA